MTTQKKPVSALTDPENSKIAQTKTSSDEHKNKNMENPLQKKLCE